MSIFYQLGKIAAPSLRKAKWFWHTACDDHEKAVRAEYAVGCDMARQIESEYPLSTDAPLKALLEDTGKRLAQHVADRTRTFKFKALDSDTPQAFCLPGGFVYISTALVELCQSQQGQLAFVLAHEMAHVIRGHALERMVGTRALAAASKVITARTGAGHYVRSAGMNLLTSAYSRQQEETADELALYLLQAAGFDPYAADELFANLSQLNTTTQITKYFATHPCPEDRRQNIKKLAGKNV